MTVHQVIKRSNFGLDWIIGKVMSRTVGSAGKKLFHPYQVGIFVDKRPLPLPLRTIKAPVIHYSYWHICHDLCLFTSLKDKAFP